MLVTLGGQRVIDNCSLPTNIVSSLCISPAGQNMIYFISLYSKMRWKSQPKIADQLWLITQTLTAVSFSSTFRNIPPLSSLNESITILEKSLPVMINSNFSL